MPALIARAGDRGAADGDNIEVIGNLRPGDKVVRRATDEIRDGAPLPSK